MRQKDRNIHTTGIIFRKTPFKETSLILEVFTQEFSKISVIAKGIKREKSKDLGLTEILNELELVLHKTNEWYILKSATLIKSHLFEVDFNKNILMQAAVEIYRQLIIPEEDSKKLYELLIKYFNYLKQVNINGIAIFWRFLLRVLTISGIELNVISCVNCKKQKTDFMGYYPQKNGFICKNCYRPVLKNSIIKISDEVTSIFSNIYQIGNILNKIEISKSTINQINKIFLIHLSEHFHKKFHLKSLELY
ncbi:MAG: DNA repair protein RecO [Armatimonadetes bacterium]|nr:DNA repair protein RecO [Armatimonadota bacterium]